MVLTPIAKESIVDWLGRAWLCTRGAWRVNKALELSLLKGLERNTSFQDSKNSHTVMTPQEEFKEAMHDIHKYSVLIGLEDQGLLQSWVKRLVQAGASSDSGQDPGKALDYARYLAYQLQQGQLRFPFSQRPAEGPLCDLKELLFGADSVDDAAADLSTSCYISGGRVVRNTRQRALSPLSPKSPTIYTGPSWDSHRRTSDEASDWHWQSHVADPKGERDIAARLEELPENAPLYLLLTEVCPHTRDGGALLHAVVAEELAEWSARSAAAVRAVPGRGDDNDEEEEEWGPRADRRADYWHEVVEAQKRLREEDPKAAEQLSVDINSWLVQQSKQMQGENALLQALAEEVRGINSQVTQSRRWKEAQFDVQNRALMTEITALKERILKTKEKIGRVNQAERSPQTRGSPTTVEAKRKLSTSIDSLNTSQDINNRSN